MVPERHMRRGAAVAAALAGFVLQPGDARAIIAAAFDGSVLCHQPDGRLIWKAPTGGHMPFDLAVAEIDGDRLDEALVASADGSLYAIDHDGRALWNFRSPAPAYTIY